MPMEKDPSGGGSNPDGTKSVMYCSYCYKNGAFTWPDCTVEQMQELVKGKLVEMGFPKFLAKFFVMRIPKLERWKKSN